MRTKTMLFLALMLFLAGGAALSAMEGKKISHSRQSKSIGYVPGQWSYTPFQLSFWDLDRMMLFPAKADVRGLNIALQSVNTSKGISVALSQEAGEVAGVTVAPLLITTESILLHVSLFGHVLSNKALAIGIYNRSYYNHFLQIGCFNDAIRTSIGQIGVWNIGPGRKDGDGLSAFQIGFMNSADSGLQIGLFNYNKNSIFPYTLLFNYSSPSKAKAKAEAKAAVVKTEGKKEKK